MPRRTGSHAAALPWGQGGTMLGVPQPCPKVVPTPQANRLRPSATMPALASREAVEAFARAVLEELEVNDGLLQRPDAPFSSGRLPTAPSFLSQLASGPRLAVGTSTAVGKHLRPAKHPAPRASAMHAPAPSAAVLASVAELLPPELASRSATPSCEKLHRAIARSDSTKVRRREQRQRTLDSYNVLKQLPYTPPTVDSHPKYVLAAEAAAEIRAREHAVMRAKAAEEEEAAAAHKGRQEAVRPTSPTPAPAAPTAPTATASTTGATHAMRQQEFNPPPPPKPKQRPTTGLDQLARATGIGRVYSASPRLGVPPQKFGGGFTRPGAGSAVHAPTVKLSSRALWTPGSPHASPTQRRPDTSLGLAASSQPLHPRAPPTSPETSLIGSTTVGGRAGESEPLEPPLSLAPSASHAPDHSTPFLTQARPAGGFAGGYPGSYVLADDPVDALNGGWRATSSASTAHSPATPGYVAPAPEGLYAPMGLSSSGSLSALRPVRINRRWVHTAPSHGMRPGRARSEHAPPPPFEPFLTTLQPSESEPRFTIRPTTGGVPSTPTESMSSRTRTPTAEQDLGGGLGRTLP